MPAPSHSLSFNCTLYTGDPFRPLSLSLSSFAYAMHVFSLSCAKIHNSHLIITRNNIIKNTPNGTNSRHMCWVFGMVTTCYFIQTDLLIRSQRRLVHFVLAFVEIPGDALRLSLCERMDKQANDRANVHQWRTIDRSWGSAVEGCSGSQKFSPLTSFLIFGNSEKPETPHKICPHQGTAGTAGTVSH